MRRALVSALAFALALGCAGGPRPRADVALEVRGAVDRPIALSPAEFRGLPHVELTVAGTRYAGVPVADVLRLAGVPLGEALRGESLELYVVAEAADGYRVVYSLAELDPATSSSAILIVDAENGQPLSAHDGPLRLVAPGDLRHARWVRQLLRIVIQRG